MSPEQFAYWLQGFVELNGGKAPTPEQWKSIKEHLAVVFTKVTPPVRGRPKITVDEAEVMIRPYYPGPQRIC